MKRELLTATPIDRRQNISYQVEESTTGDQPLMFLRYDRPGRSSVCTARTVLPDETDDPKNGL